MKAKQHSNLTSILDLQRQISDAKLKIALLESALLEDEMDEQQEIAAAQGEMSETPSHFDNRMLTAIRKESRKLEKTNWLHAIPKVAKAAAAVLLLSFLLGGTAMAVSSEVRVLVMKLLYRVTPQYTEISLVPDEEASFQIPAGWEGLFFPSYIPVGYSLHDLQGNGPVLNASYRSNDNGNVQFSEHDYTVEINTDTEGYVLEDILLNGEKALLAYKAGRSKIVWQQANRILIVITTEDPQFTLRVAQSVVRIK